MWLCNARLLPQRMHFVLSDPTCNKRSHLNHPSMRVRHHVTSFNSSPNQGGSVSSRQSPLYAAPDDLNLPAAVEVLGPEAFSISMVYAQPRKDISNLLDLTPEGHSAMYLCFANDETGRFYMRTGMNSPVNIHLAWVKDHLIQYCLRAHIQRRQALISQ